MRETRTYGEQYETIRPAFLHPLHTNSFAPAPAVSNRYGQSGTRGDGGRDERVLKHDAQTWKSIAADVSPSTGAMPVWSGAGMRRGGRRRGGPRGLEESVTGVSKGRPPLAILPHLTSGSVDAVVHTVRTTATEHGHHHELASPQDLPRPSVVCSSPPSSYPSSTAPPSRNSCSPQLITPQAPTQTPR